MSKARLGFETLEGRDVPAPLADGTFDFDFRAALGIVGDLQDAYGVLPNGRQFHAVAGLSPGNGPRVAVYDNGPTYLVLNGVRVAGDFDTDVFGQPGNAGPTLLASFFVFEEEFRGGIRIGAAPTDGDTSKPYDIYATPLAGGSPIVRFFDPLTGEQSRDPVFFGAEDFRGGVGYITSVVTPVPAGLQPYLIVTAGPGGGPVLTSVNLETGEQHAYLMGPPDDRSGLYRPIPGGATPGFDGPGGAYGIYVEKVGTPGTSMFLSIIDNVLLPPADFPDPVVLPPAGLPAEDAQSPIDVFTGRPRVA